MCQCDSKKIAKLCAGEKYAPGVYPRLHITCCDEVSDIPDPAANTSTVSANIVMRAAVVGPPAVSAGLFYTWEFDMKTAEYSSEKDDNGLWTTQLKVFIPKLNADKSQKLNTMNGPSHIVLFEDMNQEGKRIIGDILNGCEVMVKEVTNPKNGYDVTIKWFSAQSPLWYTGTVTV